jgi:hypothetical protein
MLEVIEGLPEDEREVSDLASWLNELGAADLAHLTPMERAEWDRRVIRDYRRNPKVFEILKTIKGNRTCRANWSGFTAARSLLRLPGTATS